MNSKTFKILLWVGVLSSQFGFLADGARGQEAAVKKALPKKPFLFTCGSPEYSLIKKLSEGFYKPESKVTLTNLSSTRYNGIVQCNKCEPKNKEKNRKSENNNVVSNCIAYDIEYKNLNLPGDQEKSTDVVQNAIDGLCGGDLQYDSLPNIEKSSWGRAKFAYSSYVKNNCLPSVPAKAKNKKNTDDCLISKKSFWTEISKVLVLCDEDLKKYPNGYDEVYSTGNETPTAH